MMIAMFIAGLVLAGTCGFCINALLLGKEREAKTVEVALYADENERLKVRNGRLLTANSDWARQERVIKSLQSQNKTLQGRCRSLMAELSGSMRSER